MIMCVWWRRKRTKREREKEKKAREDLEAGVDSDDEFDELKLVRTRQRIWAKATARWKANVRLSARRRWKRQAGAKDSTSRSLTERLHGLPSTISLPCAAEAPDPAFHAAEPSASSPPAEHSNVRATSAFPEPPAYLSQSSDSQGGSEFPDVGDTIPTSPRVPGVILSAHVATDEKGMLARMASMASAPPAGTFSSFHPPTMYASVPDDTEFEELPPELQVEEASGGPQNCQTLSPTMSHLHVRVPTYSRDASPGPSSLPSPPAKPRFAAPDFYEYPPSFEEDYLGLDPEANPSAPPFEEEALPLPSAPPLELEDPSGDAAGAHPSAPPLEDAVFDYGGAATPLSAPADPPADTSRSATPPRWDAHTSPPKYLP